MNILLTGHEGMVGSRLLKYLRRSTSDKVLVFEGDVANRLDWDKHFGQQRIDMIIHLAALAGVRASMKDPEKYYHTNVNGMFNMLEFADEQMVDRVLYASSSNAYEWWGNPYAATKKMNEVQAEAFQNVRSVGMRFHTIWPGRPDMLFRKFENNEVIYINRTHYRDFININDLLSAIALLIKNFDDVCQQQRVVDIGCGKSVSVEELAKVFDFQGEWRDEPPKGERIKTKANIDWLLSLGWIPMYDILNKDHHVDYE